MTEQNGGKFKLLKCKADEVVLQEGDISTDLFKILHGHVELYLGYGTENEVLLGILGTGSCFGEFGLLLQKPSPYTVVAYSETTLYRIGEDKVCEFVRDNQIYILNMMKNMANTMITMQSHINQLSEELSEKNRIHKRFVNKNKEMLKRYIYNR